ncbi:MAG: DUF3592 domain-containing protein [Planctomycetes bacterium]|nr:DUF3592 domain-containing protein [Planctomycetota bacterium]
MRWATYLGYSTLLCGMGGICFGFWSIYDQHRKITTFEYVDAVVLSHRIEEEKAKYFVLQIPVVEFEYTIAGLKYVSDLTTPTECAGTEDWPKSVFEAYPVGSEVRAKVNPRRPNDAYLIAKYSAKPYLIVLVSVVIGAMGIGAILEQIALSNAPSDTQDTISGSLLRPKRDHRSLSRTLATVGTLGLFAGVPTTVHYFRFPKRICG